MPLIDDQTKGTDHRRRPWWPWMVVAVALSALWLVVSVLVSLVPRSLAQQNAPQNAVRALNSDLIARAQTAHSYANYAAAVSLIDGVDASQPMEVMEKHTYFKVAAQSKLQMGDGAGAAKYYDRYLTFGLRAGAAECAGCHAGPAALPPNQVSDLETSSLGSEYASALRKAGTLEQTRKQLLGHLKSHPNDLRDHLLLFHIERARKDLKAAEPHVKVLRAASSVGAAPVGGPDPVR